MSWSSVCDGKEESDPPVCAIVDEEGRAVQLEDARQWSFLDWRGFKFLFLSCVAYNRERRLKGKALAYPTLLYPHSCGCSPHSLHYATVKNKPSAHFANCMHEHARKFHDAWANSVSQYLYGSDVHAYSDQELKRLLAPAYHSCVRGASDFALCAAMWE